MSDRLYVWHSAGKFKDKELSVEIAIGDPRDGPGETMVALHIQQSIVRNSLTVPASLSKKIAEAIIRELR